MPEEQALDPMRCQELVELLTEYLEGTLQAVERARLDAHLKVCPACTMYLEQMRMTLAVAGRLEEERLEPAVRQGLVAAFREWKRA